ncbi:4197_t:CDS:2 [Ambispora leptoticha]|uniref:4197_t:CDS:1 n=1 Tax=Ambispora leptoticha TaxID=144679 RepID=A0A9N9E0U6_9GLOM|nr:4197_t:CDS:2 [Ambispora leptoticha]
MSNGFPRSLQLPRDREINVTPESGEQEQYYDKSYFDSEEEEENGALHNDSIIEKYKKPSDDELLYDPDLDEKDEIWMQRKLSSNYLI